MDMGDVYLGVHHGTYTMGVYMHHEGVYMGYLCTWGVCTMMMCAHGVCVHIRCVCTTWYMHQGDYQDTCHLLPDLPPQPELLLYPILVLPALVP